MLLQITSEDTETKHCYICFLQIPGYKLSNFKPNKFLNNILPAKERKNKWMSKNKVGKSTSCTHW